MTRLPPTFDDELPVIRELARNTDGWLSDHEIDFLSLLGAYPTTSGVILELGSYRGKSAIVLARSAALADQATVVTVDPYPHDVLVPNLQKAGVADRIEIHPTASWDVIADWSRPIRLLWHDGAHTYDVVRQDVRSLIPHLQDRAIVAFHDVLNPSGDRIRVYVEQVLDSPHFAAAGVCGSIGWGQYRQDAGQAIAYERRKRRLRRKLARLIPYQSATGPDPRGLHKIRYKLLRACVPHRRVHPASWLRSVA